MTMQSDPHANGNGQPTPSLEEQRASLRERMIWRFQVWLDEALDPEAVPQGLAAEILDKLDAEDGSSHEEDISGDDLRAVSEALVGLTDATKSQSSSFKELQDKLPAIQTLTDTVTTFIDRLAADRKEQAEAMEKQAQEHLVQARRDIFKEVLDTILDMRDRLVDYLATARTQMPAKVETPAPPKRKWWQFFRRVTPVLPAPNDPHHVVEAMIKGYQMGIERIDTSLERWHVTPIGGVGQSFDQESMKAVGLEQRDDLADGTIVEVVRVGYLWNKVVHRQAEVKVVRNLEVQASEIAE